MIAGEPAIGRDYRLHRELLIAIERARSQLAVAIAAENKSTPRDRWHQYLETEDRMRKCVKAMRHRRQPDPAWQRHGLQALNLLKQSFSEADPYPGSRAGQLCRRLYEVLALIEAGI